MINRRSLRIKAFKNLYSYESCKGANYLLGLDMIDKKFSPDLNSMDIEDKDELDDKKALAIEAFDYHFDKENKEVVPSKEVEREVKDALEFVERQNKADLRKLSKDILEEASKVTIDHLLIISLLEELAFQNKKLSDKKKSLAVILGEEAQSKSLLYRNKVVSKLKENEVYQKLKGNHKVSWSNQQDQLRSWYKGVLLKDATFKEYLQKESTNYEEDWEILDYLCRGVIFKNDVFTSFFEDIDIDWSENKSIVRSLVLKTLKSVKEESDDLQITDISYNWEDDSEYVRELFKLTAQENEYLESLLKGKL
jgi:N utilization substance protein B